MHMNTNNSSNIGGEKENEKDGHGRSKKKLRCLASILRACEFDTADWSSQKSKSNLIVAMERGGREAAWRTCPAHMIGKDPRTQRACLQSSARKDVINNGNQLRF